MFSKRGDMAKATRNLAAAQSVRLRHDQVEAVERIVKNMSEEELIKLKEEDRSKFKYPEFFKNMGRPAPPQLLIIRQALDLWIDQQLKAKETRENPSLFDGLEDK